MKPEEIFLPNVININFTGSKMVLKPGPFGDNKRYFRFLKWTATIHVFLIA
jgi:hypothetical protein